MSLSFVCDLQHKLLIYMNEYVNPVISILGDELIP